MIDSVYNFERISDEICFEMNGLQLRIIEIMNGTIIEIMNGSYLNL